jgi:hypothetical protein
MKYKQNAIAALRQDCEITGSFYCQGKTCAVGCLAIMAGTIPSEFSFMRHLEVINRVANYFGIGVHEVHKIMELNDSIAVHESNHIKKRQDKVIAYLETIWEDHEE